LLFITGICFLCFFFKMLRSYHAMFFTLLQLTSRIKTAFAVALRSFATFFTPRYQHNVAV